MTPWLVRSAVYPLHELLCGRRTFANLRELERTQWLSANALHEYQQRKLADLLTHAARHCPYYGHLFAECGVDPSDSDPRAALARLPLLDKPTIRGHREQMAWTDVPGGLHEAATGGSTGEPLRFYFDRRRQSYDKAARMRTHRWFGADVGDREVYLWGNPLELSTQDRLKHWRDRLTNELLLSAFDLTPERMSTYLARIERFDPVCLFGYPSSLTWLSEYGASIGREPRPGSLKVVFVTGELLDDDQRRTLTEYFGVPVANGYGSREAGFIAHDCPQGQMHVTDENLIVEIVDEAGRPRPDGKTGEIVITHLDAWAMPLLRYRTGDLGRRDTDACTCGRGLSGLEIIGGRRTDHLVATDGTVMHGLSLIYILRETPEVGRFQIWQDAHRRVEVRIVPADLLDSGDCDRIEHRIRDLLGWDADLSIRIVDSIETTASGKYRCVVSEAAGDGYRRGDALCQRGRTRARASGPD